MQAKRTKDDHSRRASRQLDQAERDLRADSSRYQHRTILGRRVEGRYLAALPADRRAALSAVHKAINENLPDGYEKGMQFGMIGWYVPLSFETRPPVPPPRL